jgi:ubiquitin-conjugating enzyme E2 Z
MGSEKQAKSYIRKIRHETLRISVIQRLESYMKMDEVAPMAVPVADEDFDDERTRRASPVAPQIGMWEDECKRLFLWYYEIYLVCPLTMGIEKSPSLRGNKEK